MKSKTKKRILAVVGVLAVALAVFYYWGFLESHVAESGAYSIDIAELRRLASSVPGEKPQEVRVEQPAAFSFPATVIVAGDGWAMKHVPVYAYQLVYPEHTAIIDTAMDWKTGKEAYATASDDASYERMAKAMLAASLIVITHEHMDHLGGLATHPEVKKLLAVTRLNPEQIANLDRMEPAKFPPGALDGYQPLTYERYHALAPGLVLIRAPGHTPGSQMVFVQTAAGTEFLFLGDVAWHFRNVETMRERAHLVTNLMKEDRAEVTRQLAELNRLHTAEPSLHLIPGHDPLPVESLVAQGALKQNFK